MNLWGEVDNEGGTLLPEHVFESPLGQKWGRYDCRQVPAVVLSAHADIVIRTTTPADWTFINDLQRGNTYAVGFLPERTWRDYVWGGQRNFLCFLCLVNGQPAGYYVYTPGRAAGSAARGQQIVVLDDFRRAEYGRALVDAALDFCRDFGRAAMTLRCRADLDANKFWTALGFGAVGFQPKGTRNHMGWVASNDIVNYRRDLDEYPTLWEAP